MAKTKTQEEKPQQKAVLTAVIFEIQNSSQISVLTYMPTVQQLHTRFKRGGEYIYDDVSQAEFDSILNSESIGKAHNETIVQAGKTAHKVIQDEQ